MDTQSTSIALAFAAGILSFVSPCVLPLIPVYIGYLGGSTVGEGRNSRLAVMSHAVAFMLGFALVFISLGASVGLIGYLLYDYLPLMRQVGSVILVVFGLHLLGILHIPFLYYDRRLGSVNPRPGYVASFLVGLTFAAGWTPCVGPILAGILLLASTTQTVAQGALLLAVYSAGMGLHFLITALAVGQVSVYLKRLNRYLGAVEKTSGILLIVMAILIFTNTLARLGQFFSWVPPL